MAKKMTQEQLALALHVSPAAISKWERNLSVPGVEILWALADFFECSIDELVGRSPLQVEQIGDYDEKKFRLMEIGDDLLKCAKLSREQGLLALEEAVPQLQGNSRFLAFSISCLLDLFMRQLQPDLCFRLLDNYVFTLPEAERAEGRMIAETIRMIFSGENPEIIQETVASHIGMDYCEKREALSVLLKNSRQDILSRYEKKKTFSNDTNLLEDFADLDDFTIRAILRNTDNSTLTAALTGASGRVAVRFLSNLSDRMLYFISEDMEQWQGTEEDILAAQRKLLETGSFCLSSH
ncbi:MAG: helix-turn-helix domain-containing protein [Roseburia sp.]|nr:helix-turn-helix domain-containing protein [Roseburia sp.]MCM1098350.1 helix-turn-helix domain-containing protein [Ruminococcus flavefaciens]